MLARLKPYLAEPLLHVLGAGLFIFVILGGSNAVNRENRGINYRKHRSTRYPAVLPKHDGELV